MTKKELLAKIHQLEGESKHHYNNCDILEKKLDALAKSLDKEIVTEDYIDVEMPKINGFVPL